MSINNIGGIAKLAKKAVAPASLKGSFFWNSKKAFRKCLQNKNSFDSFNVDVIPISEFQK